MSQHSALSAKCRAAQRHRTKPGGLASSQSIPAMMRHPGVAMTPHQAACIRLRKHIFRPCEAWYETSCASVTSVCVCARVGRGRILATARPRAPPHRVALPNGLGCSRVDHAINQRRSSLFTLGKSVACRHPLAIPSPGYRVHCRCILKATAAYMRGNYERDYCSSATKNLF
jgi:hypothetical protein